MNRAQHEEAERPKVETWASRRWGSFGQLPVSRNRKHRYWTRHPKINVDDNAVTGTCRDTLM